LSVYQIHAVPLRSSSFGPVSRSLGVVEATTLRPLGFGRQAESRKVRLDHLKMKLGITAQPLCNLHSIFALFFSILKKYMHH
jgi:hypothetical protein